jgi:hypothetical protein
MPNLPDREVSLVRILSLQMVDSALPFLINVVLFPLGQVIKPLSEALTAYIVFY